MKVYIYAAILVAVGTLSFFIHIHLGIFIGAILLAMMGTIGSFALSQKKVIYDRNRGVLNLNAKGKKAYISQGIMFSIVTAYLVLAAFINN